jgi:DeoR/GlpR family transcriptional regulator of sugar metabolism
MRIFLSHSSKHKPLVREVKKNLPTHIRSWIDEEELLVGEELHSQIKEAIETDTDFVIIFIDSYAVKSPWVKRELEWALDYEDRIGRTFVLPIVLESEAWAQIEPAKFRSRKYLECLDYSEEGIKNLANGLISQLFSWLDRDLAAAKTELRLDSSLRLLDEADRYLIDVANEIRLIVHAFDRDNPLPLIKLFDILKRREDFGDFSEDKLNDLLVRLRQQGYLAGFVCDGHGIFVEEEHYGWKTTVYTDVKRRIARKAISYIHSGSVVALDAGSTTIEIARQISRGLKMGLWNDLTIITNSIPAANELLTTGDEIGLEDDNDIIRVLVSGGRVRPNTLAIVGDEAFEANGCSGDLEAFLTALKGSDLCFVGTNGVYWNLGFTTSDVTETKTKAAFLKTARRRFIVTDPSKFGVRQGRVFATFDENIEIITERSEHLPILDDYEARLKETTTRIIYAE